MKFGFKDQSRKSILGKLLASEDIHVRFSSMIKTACFDLYNRTLFIPVFTRSMSQHLVDMFLAHEASHALHTPQSEYTDKVKELVRKFNLTEEIVHHYLNVIEDIRINKIIQGKYPGTKIDFRIGYSERFHNKDYGTTDPAIMNNFNLIDRINLYAKISHCVDIMFSGKEIDLVKEALKTTTFSEVVDVAEKILQYSKDNQTENQSASRKKQEDSYQLKLDKFGIELEAVPSADKEEGENKSKFTSLDLLPPNKLDSVTAYVEQKSQEGYSHDAGKSSVTEYHFYDEPTFSNDYKKIYHNAITRGKKPYSIDINWKKNADNLVTFMAHEFESMKAAHDYTYQSYKVTGDVDLNSLAHYKTRDDIFKKRVLLPEHKNHGFFMLVDMSGSMKDYMKDTRRQVLLFVMLARRLNIPFEVYTFTDSLNSRHFVDQEKTFGIGRMFSSDMTKSEFDFMFNRWAYGVTADLTVNETASGGTPLIHSTLAMYPMMHDFVTKHKIEVLNFISVTDGQGTDKIGTVRDMQTVHITLKKSGKNVQFDHMLNHEDVLVLLKNTLLEDGIRSNFVDFYICESTDGFEVSKRRGYDESYRLSPSIVGGTNNMDYYMGYSENTTANEIHNGFKNYTAAKSAHKKILRKMVHKLAKFD